MGFIGRVFLLFQFYNHFIVGMLSFSCSKQTNAGPPFCCLLETGAFSVEMWIYETRLTDCQSRISSWKLSCSSGWLVGGSTTLTVLVKKLPLRGILCAYTHNASSVEPTCVWMFISFQRAGRVGYVLWNREWIVLNTFESCHPNL